MHKEKVIIATPGGSFFRDPHVRAFEKFGFECVTFNARHGLAYNPLFKKIARHIPVLSYIKKRNVEGMNQELIALVKKLKPKYLFVQKGESISPSTIEKIKSLGVITINFYNDFEWSVISKIASHYNYFFTQDRVMLRKLWDELQLRNCFYMAHAAEPLTDPCTQRQNKYEISFIGTHNNKLYPHREEYLMAVKDLGLTIWGNREWAYTPLKDCFRGRSHGDQRFDIYSTSKIVIDINWEHFISEGVSVRPFEVAASGACLFVDVVKGDIRNVYEENKEFISFSSPQELRDKVTYYLAHDQEREKIALAGYRRTVAEHTYIHRVGQLLDTIETPEKYLYK